MMSNTSEASGDGRSKPPAFDLAELVRRARGGRPRPSAPGDAPFQAGQGVDFHVDDPDVASED